jgi:hypothetical protein
MLVAPAAGASFSIGGAPNAAFSITIPSGTITMTTGGGATLDQQISVSNFTSSPSGSGTLNAAGAATVNVGATRAAIRGTQASGTYTGTFTVTVAYQ